MSAAKRVLPPGLRSSGSSASGSSPHHRAKRVHGNTEIALIKEMNRVMGVSRQPAPKVKTSRRQQTAMNVDTKLTSRQADVVAALQKKEAADAAVKAARVALAAKVAQIKAQRKALKKDVVPDLSAMFAKMGGKRRKARKARKA